MNLDRLGQGQRVTTVTLARDMAALRTVEEEERERKEKRRVREN